MRFLALLLLAAITAHAVVAEPGIFGDLVSSIKNATKGVTDTAKNAINNAIEKAKNLYKNVLGEFSSMADKLKDIEKKIKNGDMLKSTFDSAKRFVNSTEIQIQEMLKFIDENLEKVTKETVKILLKETSDLKTWANRTLDKVQDPIKRKKGEEIVNSFVDKSLDKMNKCAKEATKPIQELYEYANATATEAATLARKVVNMLEICSQKSQMITCVSKMPEILKEGNDLMTKKILPMKAKAAAIGTKGAFKFSTCVAGAKITIEFEKSSVEGKVKELID